MPNSSYMEPLMIFQHWLQHHVRDFKNNIRIQFFNLANVINVLPSQSIPIKVISPPSGTGSLAAEELMMMTGYCMYLILGM